MTSQTGSSLPYFLDFLFGSRPPMGSGAIAATHAPDLGGLKAFIAHLGLEFDLLVIAQRSKSISLDHRLKKMKFP